MVVSYLVCLDTLLEVILVFWVLIVIKIVWSMILKEIDAVYVKITITIAKIVKYAFQEILIVKVLKEKFVWNVLQVILFWMENA